MVLFSHGCQPWKQRFLSRLLEKLNMELNSVRLATKHSMEWNLEFQFLLNAQTSSPLVSWVLLFRSGSYVLLLQFCFFADTSRFNHESLRGTPPGISPNWKSVQDDDAQNLSSPINIPNCIREKSGQKISTVKAKSSKQCHHLFMDEIRIVFNL